MASPSPKKDDKRGGSGSGTGGGDEKRYVQIPPETVQVLSETIEIPNLNPNISRALSEDASYRTRELTHIASQFLRHSKKKKMTVDDLNVAMKWYDVQKIYGYGGTQDINFQFIEEVGVFIEQENVTNLQNLALNNQPLNLDPKPSVTVEWLTLEGMPVGDDSKPTKDPPEIHPALVQYYNMAVAAILGDCSVTYDSVIKDIRTNSKLAPLLSTFVAFIRSVVHIKSEDQKLTSRLLDVIGAIITNPHFNLSPKPYLNHIVTALLSNLISERPNRTSLTLKQSNGLASPTNSKRPDSNGENVAKSARLMVLLIDNWATSVNLLANQTIDALRDPITDINKSHAAQYGALYALNTLGPQVVRENLLPHLQEYVRKLDTAMESLDGSLDRISAQLKMKSLVLLKGTALECAKTLISNLMEESSGEIGLHTYKGFYELYGDSFLVTPIIPGRVAKLPDKEIVGKLRVSKLKSDKMDTALPSSVLPSDQFGVPPSNIFDEPMDTSSDRLRISPSVQNCFETDKDSVISRRVVNLNYGSRKPQDQLKGGRFQSEMKSFRVGDNFSRRGYIGRRMAYPLTTERYKLMRLFTSYSLMSTVL